MSPDVHAAHIRTFSFPDDYPGAHALWSNAGEGIHLGASDSPGEIEKKVRRDPDLFLLAEEDGEIVGTVLGGFDGRRGFVYHLAVEEGHRKRGIASLLMDELERRLRSLGCIRVHLLVVPDNAGAMQFYEARGWEKMDLFAYAKDLT